MACLGDRTRVCFNCVSGYDLARLLSGRVRERCRDRRLAARAGAHRHAPRLLAAEESAAAAGRPSRRWAHEAKLTAATAQELAAAAVTRAPRGRGTRKARLADAGRPSANDSAPRREGSRGAPRRSSSDESVAENREATTHV